MFVHGTSVDGLTVPSMVSGGEPKLVRVTYLLDQGNTRLRVTVDGAGEWDFDWSSSGEVLRFLGKKGIISNPDEWTIEAISYSDEAPFCQDDDEFVNFRFRRQLNP